MYLGFLRISVFVTVGVTVSSNNSQGDYYFFGNKGGHYWREGDYYPNKSNHDEQNGTVAGMQNDTFNTSGVYFLNLMSCRTVQVPFCL